MTDVSNAYPEGRVILREVGLRDGLQLTKSFPSTAIKIEWLQMEYKAGIRHFEVGSFLPPARFPQFCDVRAIIEALNDLDGAHSIALAINQRGQADALTTQVREITCVISATEEHNLANARCSREETLENIARTTELRKRAENPPLINVGIAMAFGCSISGKVAPDDVVSLAERCLELGADIVGIADTVGFGGPRQTDSLCRKMSKLCGKRPYLVHLHDTRGTGIANAAAALDAGARIFDASLGGLGGCPFAPGASGNVVMEDLAYLCQTMGFATEIDIEKLINVRSILEREMPEEPLHGAVAISGVPKMMDERAA
jgi:hydroxymethylglutaryl-CoA lyase